ncbi:MAG: class I SAM-dependent methyltransferase [Acidimicrobiales bacterium]
MKYDAEVDLANANTSHAIVVELVGSGQRVLDVGCSTGYLAAALAARGNEVSGVELDPEAAEQARPHLEQLVVGDLEHLDLVESFGERSFDVLVFADVLEHLRNPAEVLRRAAPLLDRDGSAVISIPNVAHGAVRLALLQGHFDYSSTGLLDDTHLRFYTRETVDSLLRTAGFACVELRRTTASPFETEIPLESDAFPAEVLDAVVTDPNSATYQFVLRAVPLHALGNVLGNGPLERLLGVQNRQFAEAREQLSLLAGRAAGAAHSPLVGIASASGELLDDLRAAVIHAELRRRLDGFGFRLIAEAKTDRRAPHGFGGEPLHLLAGFGAATAASLATVLNALVLIDGPVADGARDELDAFITRLEEGGCRVHFLCSPGADASPPDVLVLADQLSAPLDLALRLDYLRAAGTVPEGPYLVVQASPEGDDEQLALKRSVDTLSRQIGGSVVRLDGSMSGTRDPLDAASLDLLATVAGADLVRADEPGLLALAEAFGRSRIALALGEETRRAYPGTVTLDTRAADPSADEPRRNEAERYFDELAAALIHDSAGAICRSAADQLTDLRERVATLEATNAGLRASIARERREIGKRWSGVPTDAPATPAETWAAKLTAEEKARVTAEELAAVKAELAALQNTLTMRTLRPARRLYGRLRFHR